MVGAVDGDDVGRAGGMLGPGPLDSRLLVVFLFCPGRIRLGLSARRDARFAAARHGEAIMARLGVHLPKRSRLSGDIHSSL